MARDIESYRDLLVWQRGVDLAEGIYRLTKSYPREEMFGLTSQTRRAAISVPANIAEGYGRNTRAAYVNFLRIARGSLKEMETHLIIAHRIGLARSDAVESPLEQSAEIGRMLNSLIAKLLIPQSKP